MESSLLQWINTLPGGAYSSLDELLDIRKFAQIFQAISDQGFACDLPDAPSWIQHKSAWDQFLGLLSSYFVTALGASVSIDTLHTEICNFVDVEALTHSNDVGALCRATYLLLAASVKGAKKDQIIYRIMQFPTNIQTNLMGAIQQAMEVLQRACVDKTEVTRTQQTPVEPGSKSTDQSIAHLTTEISELKHRNHLVSQEKEKLMDAVRELDARLQAAEKTKRNLESMLEEETRKSASLRAREISSSPATFEMKGKGSRHLAQENETLRATVQQREKSIQDLRKQVESASQNVFKIKELQDEVEILRDKSSRVDQLQEKIKTQERRLGELVELKLKYQEAEQHLTVLQKQKQEWDEIMTRQVPQMRVKIDSYKNQVVELTAKSADLESALAVKEKQLRDAQVKLDDALRTQKQQDLLLKDLSKSNPLSRDISTPIVAPVPQQPQKKNTLANLLHTVDPEAEKKAKEAQETLVATLNDAKARLDLLEDELQTKTMLCDRIQQELASNKLRLAEISDLLEATTQEREQLQQQEIELKREVSSLKYQLEKSQTESKTWKEKATHAQQCLDVATSRISELELKLKVQEMQNKLIVSAYYNNQLELYQAKLAPQMSIDVGGPANSVEASSNADTDFQSADEFSKMLDGSKWNAGLSDATEELQKPQVAVNRRITQAASIAKTATDRKLSVAAIRQRALQPVDANSIAKASSSAAPAPSKRLTLAERALAPRPPLGSSQAAVNPYESAAKRQKIRE